MYMHMYKRWTFCLPFLEFWARAHVQPDKITCKQCVLSQQLVSLAFSNLANEELARRYLLIANMQVNSTVFSCENRTISVTFRASRFINKLLSRIMSENATLLFPSLSHFVVIKLVVSDLRPFEEAIAGT